MTNAAHRVEAYLDALESFPGNHPDVITGVGHEGGITALTATDLRVLIALAELSYKDNPGLSELLERKIVEIRR